MLMTMISGLHNLSRSIGCALLATSSKVMVVYFVGGEIVFYLGYKIVRKDFMYWVQAEGVMDFVVSLLTRVIVKVVVDFSGCLHFRHPLELGGAAFSCSLLWVSPHILVHQINKY